MGAADPLAPEAFRVIEGIVDGNGLGDRLDGAGIGEDEALLLALAECEVADRAEIFAVELCRFAAGALVRSTTILGPAIARSSWSALVTQGW